MPRFDHTHIVYGLENEYVKYENNNDPSKKTLNWIRNNLPKEKEITTEYYNRYTNNCEGNKISNSQFGKLVREQGYKPIRGTHHRFWIKK